MNSPRHSQLLRADSREAKRMADLIKHQGETEQQPLQQQLQLQQQMYQLHLQQASPQEFHQHVNNHQGMPFDQRHQGVPVIRDEIAELRKFLQGDLEQQFQKQNVFLVKKIEDLLLQGAVETIKLTDKSADEVAFSTNSKSEVQFLSIDACASADHSVAENSVEKQDSKSESIAQVPEEGSQPPGAGEAMVLTVMKDEVALWNELQEAIKHNTHVAYERMMNRNKQSVWHAFFKKLEVQHLIRHEMPKSSLAQLTVHPLFVVFQALLIVTNTAVMGYETDQSIKAALQDPPASVPGWLDICNLVFNIVFTIELLFRIIALRTWFFVVPGDWAWNFFDVLVVATSIANDVMGGYSISFIRTFRLLRAVRAARLIRVVRFFQELRRMMLSIIACMASLGWCFVFLCITMFVFTIWILQGVVEALNDMEPGSAQHIHAVKEARKWIGSVSDSMLWLTAAVTIGGDFYNFQDPLEYAGAHTKFAFVLFVLFITVGVMNVLTGVFLSNADAFTDRSLVIQMEEQHQESFVKAMSEVFEEQHTDEHGYLTWLKLYEALKNPETAAYLSSFDLNVTHARLVFHMLDDGGKGCVLLHEFVMGLLRLKGVAKAIDSRIIQRELGLLPKFFEAMMKGEEKLLLEQMSMSVPRRHLAVH